MDRTQQRRARWAVAQMIAHWPPGPGMTIAEMEQRLARALTLPSGPRQFAQRKRERA